MLSILHQFARFNLHNEEVANLRMALESINDWPELVKQIELYAISGFVLKHIKEHDLPIEKSHLMSLQALSMRHRSAAQARYETLQQMQLAFEKVGIPIVLLKGAALAPMMYQEESLRPMRDMDILVPKQQLFAAAEIMRELGFILPEQQPSKYMRGTHQLPNATKRVNGFIISVEVHHNALSQDVRGSLMYEDLENERQTIRWRDLELQTLGHELMLHQICRHLEGLHPGSVLKLINVMDVVGYAEHFIDELDWQRIRQEFPHILNTLQCLHLICPLSERLQQKTGSVSDLPVPVGVGEVMVPLSRIFSKQYNLQQRCQMLFLPPDWWLHLYYNVSLKKTLLLTKLIRHPLRVGGWLLTRFYSRLLGG